MTDIRVQTNGFKLTEEHTNVLKTWEKYLIDNMEVDYIDEFYYGESLVMATVILTNKHYGHFNITKNRISFNGHTCSREEYNNFGSATLNDELYVGKLFFI